MFLRFANCLIDNRSFRSIRSRDLIACLYVFIVISFEEFLISNCKLSFGFFLRLGRFHELNIIL